MVVPSVPANVIELFAVNVFPAARVNVLVPLLVMVNPLIVVNTPVLADDAPIVVPFMVPPVAVSVPAVMAFATFESVNAVVVVAPRPLTAAKVSASVPVIVTVLPNELTVLIPPPAIVKAPDKLLIELTPELPLTVLHSQVEVLLFQLKTWPLEQLVDKEKPELLIRPPVELT